MLRGKPGEHRVEQSSHQGHPQRSEYRQEEKARSPAFRRPPAYIARWRVATASRNPTNRRLNGAPCPSAGAWSCISLPVYPEPPRRPGGCATTGRNQAGGGRLTAPVRAGAGRRTEAPDPSRPPPAGPPPRASAGGIRNARNPGERSPDPPAPLPPW
ncbi:MAG: hypothetical protein MZV64_09290 [Ignavibacteriales bacterium]|nr:hypothetical protein [Ignavibacteriales bacterium]